jgi:energy-coupling factor transport system ATP-binding protein
MMRSETLIELRDVTCRRRRQGGDVETALEGVSLRVRTGESLVVLGAGGAGKTTLAAVLAGVTAPTAGEVVRAAPPETGAANLPLGLIAQNPEDTFTSPVVREEMGLVLQNLDWEDARLDRAVDAMLAEVGLEEYADSQPALLSGGQKQLLAAASIMIAEPRLLILDEPLSLLDCRGREEVNALLAGRAKCRDCSMVYLSSEVGDVLRGERTVVLAEGRVVWDGKREEFPLEEEKLSGWGLLTPDLNALAALLFPEGDPRRERVWTPGELARRL